MLLPDLRVQTVFKFLEPMCSYKVCIIMAEYRGVSLPVHGSAKLRIDLTFPHSSTCHACVIFAGASSLPIIVELHVDTQGTG